MRNYAPYVGLQYEEPHGCLKLIETVFRECYGWTLPDIAGAMDSHMRVARLHGLISRHAAKVTEPQEGDIVLLRAEPWHVGLVIAPPDMLHQAPGGHSALANYTMPKYWPLVSGFYRYTP